MVLSIVQKNSTAHSTVQATILVHIPVQQFETPTTATFETLLLSVFGGVYTKWRYQSAVQWCIKTCIRRTACQTDHWEKYFFL